MKLCFRYFSLFRNFSLLNEAAWFKNDVKWNFGSALPPFSDFGLAVSVCSDLSIAAVSGEMYRLCT